MWPEDVILSFHWQQWVACWQVLLLCTLLGTLHAYHVFGSCGPRERAAESTRAPLHNRAQLPLWNTNGRKKGGFFRLSSKDRHESKKNTDRHHHYRLIKCCHWGILHNPENNDTEVTNKGVLRWNFPHQTTQFPQTSKLSSTKSLFLFESPIYPKGETWKDINILPICPTPIFCGIHLLPTSPHQCLNTSVC